MSYKRMKFIKGNKLLLGVISILILFIAIQTVYAVSKLETDVKPFGYVTSTPEYITANTETVTTDTIDLLGIDQVDMKIQETASSTKSVLVWEYEYSDDNIDWFGEDLAEATATTTGQGNTI